MTEPRVTIADVQSAGYCARGARRWFEEHGFNFREFLKSGVTPEELRAAGGGAHAEKAIAKMRERTNG